MQLVTSPGPRASPGGPGRLRDPRLAGNTRGFLGLSVYRRAPNRRQGCSDAHQSLDCPRCPNGALGRYSALAISARYATLSAPMTQVPWCAVGEFCASRIGASTRALPDLCFAIGIGASRASLAVPHAGTKASACPALFFYFCVSTVFGLCIDGIWGPLC